MPSRRRTESSARTMPKGHDASTSARIAAPDSSSFGMNPRARLAVDPAAERASPRGSRSGRRAAAAVGRRARARPRTLRCRAARCRAGRGPAGGRARARQGRRRRRPPRRSRRTRRLRAGRAPGHGSAAWSSTMRMVFMRCIVARGCAVRHRVIPETRGRRRSGIRAEQPGPAALRADDLERAVDGRQPVRETAQAAPGPGVRAAHAVVGDLDRQLVVVPTRLGPWRAWPARTSRRSRAPPTRRSRPRPRRPARTARRRPRRSTSHRATDRRATRSRRRDPASVRIWGWIPRASSRSSARAARASSDACSRLARTAGSRVVAELAPARAGARASATPAAAGRRRGGRVRRACRSASPAATIRARDARTSPSCASTSACSRSFSTASRIGACHRRDEAGSSSSAASWTIAAIGCAAALEERHRPTGARGRQRRPASRVVQVVAGLGRPVRDRQATGSPSAFASASRSRAGRGRLAELDDEVGDSRARHPHPHQTDEEADRDQDAGEGLSDAGCQAQVIRNVESARDRRHHDRDHEDGRRHEDGRVDAPGRA